MATPLMINIGIHYATCAGDYRNGDLSAPAVKDALSSFVAAGMLIRTGDGVAAKYQATDGMRMWVDAMCKIRWPHRVWQFPTGDA